jgi:hypothetical protein
MGTSASFTSIWHCSDMFQVCLNWFVFRSLHRVVTVADLVSGFGFLIAIGGGSHATITVFTTSSFDFRLLVRKSLDMCSECILCFGLFNGHWCLLYPYFHGSELLVCGFAFVLSGSFVDLQGFGFLWAHLYFDAQENYTHLTFFFQFKFMSLRGRCIVHVVCVCFLVCSAGFVCNNIFV